MQKHNVKLTPLIHVLSQIRRCLLVFAMAGGMTLPVSNAQGADNAMPPEVSSLIGMKLPPKVVGKKTADIPNFIRLGGALISEELGNSLAYDEGIVGEKWPIFFIERIYGDRTTVILDSQMLPANLMEWQFIGGQFTFLKDRFKLSDRCKGEGEDSRLIFGLVKAEKGKSDCGHISKRVKQAWKIDRQSGQITPMSAQGLQCYFLEVSEC